MSWFTSAFAVVSLAAAAVAVPGTLDQSRFAFGDNGWAVRVDGLLADGLVPTHDFAFTYGLLTLVIDRAVFAVFGATPAATGGLVLACGLLLAVGVWRLATAMKLGVGPRLLLVGVAPLVVNPGQMPSPAHALEPVFLVFALAAQARGKLARALAFATVGVLVKPGLGYLLGATLILDLLSTAPRRAKALLPAAGVGLGLLALLVTVFGVGPVLKTQIPTEAGKVYRDQNCGLIHGDGRLFLHPEPGTEVMHFATTPAGAWAVASVILLVGGVAALPRWRRDPAARTVATMAALHASFALFFFGNRWGWTYYPFLPFVGAALALDRLPRWTPGDLGKLLTPVAGGFLGLLAVSVSVLYVGLGAVRALPLFEPAGNGLFARSDFRESWRRVEELAKTRRVFVLTRAGCPGTLGGGNCFWHFLASGGRQPPVPSRNPNQQGADAPRSPKTIATPGALVPGVDSPRSWYLSRAVAVPGELDRARRQIEACDWLVVPDWHDHDLMSWPELADAVRPFVLAEDHGAFKLYRRE